MEYLAVEIGVPSESGARELSENLVDERLAAGTRTKSGTVPGHYRWDGEVHERTYWTVTALTTDEQLDSLYDYVENHHPDDLLPITYDTLQAKPEYYEWIESNVGSE